MSEAHAASDDIGAQFAWRAVRAKALAREGRSTEAKALAREAVALADRTDALNKRAAVLLSLAEVLRAERRPQRGRRGRRCRASDSTSRRETLLPPSALGEARREAPLGASRRTRCCYIARTIGESPCGPPWPADATSGNAAVTSQPARR